MAWAGNALRSSSASWTILLLTVTVTLPSLEVQLDFIGAKSKEGFPTLSAA
jgi:hypothetical protein